MSTIVIAPGSAGYPMALTALAAGNRPPATLYVRGRLPSTPGVAIVGTRRPSNAACAFTRTLASALAGARIAIWSGGAFGIDAAAHEAALDAGGVTVLVAGGGLDRPFPPEHRGLFERVLAHGGALVARVPDQTRPTSTHLLERNELLAALTGATVVVQAGLASGARSTAAAARRLGRPLCIVPHPPWDEGGQGCAHELARGGALAVYGVEEVLAALGRAPLVPADSRRPRRGAARSEPAQLSLPASAPRGVGYARSTEQLDVSGEGDDGGAPPGSARKPAP